MIDRSHYLYFSNKDDIGPEDTNMSEVIASTGALRRRTVRIPEILNVGPGSDDAESTEDDRRVVDVAVGYGNRRRKS